MSNAKIALNMSMVKFIMWEKGPDYTFEKVKDAGISYFELSQVDMTDDFIKATLDASAKHGVKVMSTSCNFEPLFGPSAKGLDLVRDLDKIIDVNHKLGVTYVRDSLMPRSCMRSEEGFHKAAEVFNKYGKILKDNGLKLYYHNHHFEFEKFNGKTGYDILIDETDPELVGFEIDVHWAQRGGADPIKYIKKLDGRCDMVHLKDLKIVFPDIEPSPQELLHKEQCIRFAEIGEGNLDMPEIIRASIASKAVYLPIEQDSCYGKDPFDCLKLSVSNIKKMGFEDLF
ncbi:MAG: sugar phosphate isomerase/epimerase [Sphaerochaetaceae bacterium]|nr:sugar phosphate isomerase/epimerase [Sphaerochaetaceae bacterium]